MSHPIDEEIRRMAGVCLARNGIGSVTGGTCGVITLAVGCLSLRIDAVALHELAELLAQAVARLPPPAGRSAAPPAKAPSGAGDDAATAPRDPAAPLH